MQKQTYRVYFTNGNQKLFDAFCKEDVENHLLKLGWILCDFEIEII